MNGRDGQPPRDGDDEVGYGKPPKRTRFRAGQSGNPKGRPKNAFGKHHLPDVILRKAREIFIEEGDLPVKMRPTPGKPYEKPSTFSAYRLAVRAAHASALKGSALAQKTVIQCRLALEAEIAKTMSDAFTHAAVHKDTCLLERQRCRNLGLPEPKFLPDPDDIILDWNSLTLTIDGPATVEQRANLEERLKLRDEWEDDFRFTRERCEEGGRSDASLFIALQSQLMYEGIDASLPTRYRKPLPRRLSASIEDVIERLKTSAAARKRRSGTKRRVKAAGSDSPNSAPECDASAAPSACGKTGAEDP